VALKGCNGCGRAYDEAHLAAVWSTVTIDGEALQQETYGCPSCGQSFSVYLHAGGHRLESLPAGLPAKKGELAAHIVKAGKPHAGKPAPVIRTH
jgi:hypothetical protein